VTCHLALIALGAACSSVLLSASDMPSLLANLLIFARTLRAAGVVVRAGGVQDAIRALADVGITSRSDVRDVLRGVLICRHEDLAPFERLFDRFWRVWNEPAAAGSPRPMRVPARASASLRLLAPGAASDPQPLDSSTSGDPAVLQSYSDIERWRRKDFATFTAEDFARAKQALGSLVWDPGARTTRRWMPGAGGGVDARRLLRSNMKHGGELIAIPYRIHRTAPRPLILICDVSGSMEPYTRMLLLFAHAIRSTTPSLGTRSVVARGRRRVEVFVFSTQLTRVTRQFAGARADAALSRVRDAVRDWSGGTRIGDALHRFNTYWARRVLRRNPVVLLISDGWDLGDPAILAREVARLQRSSYRLIWLNPLLGSPDYEPLTRGTKAALPFVDDFLPVHDMSSIETLARHLNALG
jgi:uncharacterized protein with von Willebrand factor type A (vWA) domain